MKRIFHCINCNEEIEKDTKERYIDCPNCPEYNMSWIGDIE